MPLFGPPNIDQLKAKGDVKGLFNLSIGDKEVLSQQAHKALMEIGASAVSKLLDLVKDTQRDSKERKAALALFRAIGPSAVDPLLAALRGKEDSEKRYIAAEALGAIGDAQAGEGLLDVLKNTSVDDVMLRITIAVYAGRLVGIRAQEPLLAILKQYEDSEISMSIFGLTGIRVLGDIGDERCVERLATLVKTYGNCIRDREVWLGEAAVEALGKVGGRMKDSREHAKIESVLVDLLQFTPAMGFRYRKLCVKAALALGQLGNHNAAGALLDTLKQAKETSIRAAAAYGLRLSLDPRKVEPLIALLKDPDEQVRANAAEGLLCSEDPGAIAALQAALEDQSESVRRTAAQVLAVYETVAQVTRAAAPSSQQEAPAAKVEGTLLENEFYDLMQRQALEMMGLGYEITEIPKLATNKAADIIMKKYGIAMPEMAKIIESAMLKHS